MASDQGALDLLSLGDRLFGDKKQFDSLCQEIAWHFCPDLATFTTKLVLGQDFSIDRMDSMPEQTSRELTNQLSAMLRPNDRPWFKTTTLDDELDAVDENARGLEYLTRTIRQGMYDPRTKFVRSTKQADRFYINFGQAVISCEEAPQTRDHLFFRNFHVKNCAWLENDLGEVDHLHRKEAMSARKMMQRFKEDSLADAVKKAAEKDPQKEFEVRVVVMPSDEYDLTRRKSRRGGKKLPYAVVYIDVENETVIREGSLNDFIYVVPRWNLFAETQYAFSPCAMIAIPDARLAHMMAQILLEAGEKAIDPPMIAKQETVIGEPNLQAGGISWIDLEHDESLKDALDAIRLEPDMRIGFEMRKDLREVLAKAFFIDKLALPEPGREMTAYETGRRVEEHVRNLLPLFEPMQIEYNTRILDKSFSAMANMKMIDFSRMPKGLRNRDVTWSFQSPIQQAQEQVKVEYFKGSLELVGIGMQAGATANPINVDRGLRDSVRGMGAPASWFKTKAEMQAEAEKIAQQKQTAETLGAVGQGAQVAGHVGDAAQKLASAGQAAGLLPPQSQKVVQGAAQGAPDLAGALGLGAPDVGDQGPAAGPGENSPPPWLPEQVAAVLGPQKGSGGSNGRRPLPVARPQPHPMPSHSRARPKGAKAHSAHR